MSATPTEDTRTLAQDPPLPENLIVLQHREHKVVVEKPRVKVYDGLRELAIEHFPYLMEGVTDVTLWTTDVPGFPGELIQISKAAWPALETRMRRIIVKGSSDDVSRVEKSG
ncbi:hypothetical protein DFP72DRAFT_1175092 [Ephemerocybe angulata]|uniref:Uncharacterized protein n=1 Tax=Ephemerocybe angulata TaxID=980116 RepID=A0A8H6HHS9_9AGAR|nr:hypothetical protein DFP72DRAFT_1175092 [Tulosesus angulatus]